MSEKQTSQVTELMYILARRETHKVTLILFGTRAPGGQMTRGGHLERSFSHDSPRFSILSSFEGRIGQKKTEAHIWNLGCWVLWFPDGKPSLWD